MKEMVFNEVTRILLGEPVVTRSDRMLRYAFILALNYCPQSVLNLISSRVWRDRSAQLWLASKSDTMSNADMAERHEFISAYMASGKYKSGSHIVEFGAGTADIARLVKHCDPHARISGVNLTPCPAYAAFGEHVTGSVVDTLRLVSNSKTALFISLGSLMYITHRELRELFRTLKQVGAAVLLLEPHVSTRFGLRPNPFCFNHDYRSLLKEAGFSIAHSELIASDTRTTLVRLVATPEGT